MKIGTWILTIWLAASAWAQTSVPKAQAAAKPTGVSAAQAPAKTTAAAGKSAAPAAPAAQTAAKAKQQPAGSAATSGAALTAKHGTAKHGTAKQETAMHDQRPKVSSEAKSETGEAKPVATTKLVGKGRRDPFVSPIVERMSNSANCTGAGKRCLYIGDVRLLGIVQSSNSVIAVVESGRHTYFLREQDPLADGDVERITTDAITLRQRSSDVMGRPVVRQVIKKLGSPAV